MNASVAVLAVAIGLVACSGNTAPSSLPQRASATTISFTISASSATVQQLGSANGITPTLHIAAGAASNAFTLTATSSATAPAGTPSLSAFGFGASAAYITLSSANGPAALNGNATITVPAADIRGAAVSAIFIPDGKTGTEAVHRAASRSTLADSLAGNVFAVPSAQTNGTYQITLPLASYTGTVAIQSNANPAPQGCSNIVNFGSICLGAVTIGQNVSDQQTNYSVPITITIDGTTSSDILGAVNPLTRCQGAGSATVGALSSMVSGSNIVFQSTLYDQSVPYGIPDVSACDFTFDVEPPGNLPFFFDVSFTPPSSLPSSSPPSPAPSGPSLAFYRATDNLTTNTATYPANPGEGPVSAIADEIAADTQAFIYPVGTNLTAASGTYTVALVPTGSSAFCATSTFIYAAYTNTGAATINASTFPYPADGLNIELSDPNHATDVGACILQFSGGGATAKIPLMVNPLSISGNNSGGAFYDSLAAGGSFTIAVNPAAYTAAGLSVPASLQLDTNDEYYVNPAAGVTSGGPGAPSCIDAGVSVHLSGSGPYTLTFAPTASETNAGSECEVYVNDGVTGAPLDFLINLRS